MTAHILYRKARGRAMSENAHFDKDAAEINNTVYWKSLLSLFVAAICTIAWVLIYIFADSWLSACGEIDRPPEFLKFFYEKECEWTPSIFIITVAAGALGAIFSNITRLYQVEQISALFSQKIKAANWLHMTLYASVPAVVGSVAAAVMYLMFAANFISGTPFPKFSCPTGDSCDSINALINDWGPDHALDYAKIILWGFIVGFSERLVPDMLGQYSRLIEQKNTELARSPNNANDSTLSAAMNAVAEAKKAAEKAAAAAKAAEEKAALPSASESDKAEALRASEAAKAAQTALVKAQTRLDQAGR